MIGIPKECYPLAWPDSQPRARDRQRWSERQRMSDGKILDEFCAEVDRHEFEDWALTCNLKLKLNGIPYANQPKHADPGASLWAKRKNGRIICVACDRFNTTYDNIRALTLVLNGRRREERYGTQAMVESSWQAFEVKELPAAGRPWRAVLGFAENATPTVDEVRARHRELAKRKHPDAGGTHEEWIELQDALEQARAEVGS